MSLAERRDQRLGQVFARSLGDPQRLRDSDRQQRRICERCQLDKCHAIGEVEPRVGGDHLRQAGLADAGRANQRRQPLLLEQDRSAQPC